MAKDKENPGVIIPGVRRSRLESDSLDLLRLNVITLKDLDGMSEELKGIFKNKINNMWNKIKKMFHIFYF